MGSLASSLIYGVRLLLVVASLVEQRLSSVQASVVMARGFSIWGPGL